MFENALKSDLTSAEQATSETFWNQLELVEWSECEVRISIDWSKIRSNRPNVRYKFRSIGPNSDRMVRILLEWSEFRTNGLNSARMVRIPNKWSESGFDVAKFVEVLMPRKKISVDWPIQGQFQKICQRIECWNQKIGVDWSRQSQKRFLPTQVSLQKVSSQLVTQKVLIWQEVQ